MKPQRSLWTCPRCRRWFANRNQSHACGRHDLAHHFRGKDPAIRAQVSPRRHWLDGHVVLARHELVVRVARQPDFSDQARKHRPRPDSERP